MKKVRYAPFVYAIFKPLFRNNNNFQQTKVVTRKMILVISIVKETGGCMATLLLGL